MTTRKELENALEGILGAFPSAFNAGRMDRISAILGGIALKDLKRINDYLLDKSRYAPLPDDFKAAVSDLQIRRIEINHQGPKTKTKKLDIGFLGDGWFFDENKVFTRGASARDCKFILFEDAHDHPKVIEAKEKLKTCLDGKAKFIPSADSSFSDPSKEVYDFFYPAPKRSSFSDALKTIKENL